MDSERHAVVDALKHLATSATTDPAFCGGAGDVALPRGMPEGWIGLAAHCTLGRRHVTRI